VLVLLYLLAPLLVFFIEASENREGFLSVNVANVTAVGDKAVLTLVLNYSGTVLLTDFRVRVYGEELEFGTVVKGVYVKELTAPAHVVEGGRPSIEMTFRIAGIYGFRVVMRGG